jgi:hypothetical protein
MVEAAEKLRVVFQIRNPDPVARTIELDSPILWQGFVRFVNREQGARGPRIVNSRKTNRARCSVLENSRDARDKRGFRIWDRVAVNRGNANPVYPLAVFESPQNVSRAVVSIYNQRAAVIVRTLKISDQLRGKNQVAISRMEPSLVCPSPLTDSATTTGAVKMKLKKLVTSKNGLAADIDADNCLNLSRERHTSSTTPGRRLAGRGILAITTRGADVKIAFPPFEVRFIADKRHGITHPTKKLRIIARAKYLFTLIEHIIDPENK